MDDRDRELLVGSLRSMLASPGVDVSAELDELGWAEVLADDPAGATTMLFTEHGRALAVSAELDRVLLSELGLAGGVRRAVLYAPPGSGSGTVSADDDGVLLADPAEVDEVVVSTPGGVLVVASSQLEVVETRGFEPERGWRLARLVTPAGPSAGGPVIDDASWLDAVAAGRRALAAELNGISEVLLGIAVEHTSERVQYGRAIASYQTVRHRLAEAYAALEASRTLLDGAWVDGSAWAAAAAKAQAGSAHRDVARHATQLCGAIGLTREHRLHRFVKRGALLDALLGSTRELEYEMGERLLAGFRPPAVITL